MGVAHEAETTLEKEAGLRDCMPEAKPTNCTAQCCASSERHFSLLTSEHYCYFMHAHVQGPTMSLPLYRSCLLVSEWFCTCASSLEHSVHSYICISSYNEARPSRGLLRNVFFFLFLNKGREKLYIAPKQEGFLLKSSFQISIL